jgi:hypothetical protein
MAKGVITMRKTNVTAEFEEMVQKLTKDEAYDLLSEKVALINDGIEDDETRFRVNDECKLLCERYNELSMLTVYGVCAKAEYPILDFAKTFYFPTVKVTDEKGSDVDESGRERIVITRVIEEGEKRLDLFDFLQWAEKCNKTVTAQKNWKISCNSTRNSIEEEWKKLFASNGDTHKVSFKNIKANLQEMYDALLFIPSPSNNNRVMATNAMARYIFGFSNTTKDSRNKQGNVNFNDVVLSSKQWIKLVMNALHRTVQDKNYEPNDLGLKYGSEEATKGKNGKVNITAATAEDMTK